MITDFYMCYSHPTLKRTCIGSLICGILYPSFSAIWQWQSGSPIYPFTDWMGNAVGSLIAMVILNVVAQIVSVILWWTKRIMIKKCARKRDEVEMEMEMVMAERMHSNPVEVPEVSSEVDPGEQRTDLRMNFKPLAD